MTAFEAVLRGGARSLVDRLRLELEKERAVESRLVEDAWRDHAVLPDHYWRERHLAEQRLRCAERIIEAMKEQSP